jgi:PAS domain S-box-containing protein
VFLIPGQDKLSARGDSAVTDGRREEQSTRVIADTASDAIITIGEDSNMLFVNRAAEKIFGYSRAEMQGQSLTMLMPDYLRHVHRAGLQQYLNTGQRHISWEAIELPGLHKNGKEIPLELSFGEFTENGRRFFTGIARDITERKRLERRLSAQYQAARILAEADSMADGAPVLLQAICESLGWELGQLWIVDDEAPALRWVAAWRVEGLDSSDFEQVSRNRTFDRGVGLPGRIWATGAPAWIMDTATDANFPRGPFATKAGLRSAFGFPIMLRGEVSGAIEFFSRESQEPDRVLLETMAAVGNQIGQFLERKRVEAEREGMVLREQRARGEAEAAMDRVRCVQRVTDGALAHLSMDELLAELLDRVREAMQVDTVAILLLEAKGNELVAWAAKGLEEEVAQRSRIPVGSGFAGLVAAEKLPVKIDDLDAAEVLNPLVRQKGIRSLLGVPLLVEGRVIGVLHVGKLTLHQFTEDDTQLLQLVADRIALAIDNARLFEEEHAARQEAEAASRAKDEFLTTLSHELRTPLTPIIGWIHMIRTGMVPSQESEHGLSVIEKNSHALKRLINDLLDMSAILSGKMRMESLPIRLEAALQEAVETVRPLAADSRIHLEVSFRDWPDSVIVRGDRTRLIQAFWNLLHNAIKFSKEAGEIKVNCEANGSNAIISIEDSGSGIPSSFLPHVFDRFRQADGSKTRQFGGLGLGLALVKSFVEAHGGTVQAASAGPGRGSKFTVSLPRHVEQPDVTAAAEKRSQGVPIPPPVHLLVVDDDVDTLEMLRAAFETRGFHVTACESTADALAAAQNGPIDIIVSDIGMPRVDGYELMRRLRKLPRLEDVPAIALTGYASRKDADMAIASGFTAHVAKPAEPGELTALIDRLLQSSGARSRS